MNLLEVQNLSRSFNGVQAVSQLSFALKSGETLGLLGPNGAGKTTTMRIISGLLKADAGTIRFHGQPVVPQDLTFRRSLGVVPQDLAVYPDLTAAENLRFFGRLYGVPASTLTGRVEWALERAGLTTHAHRPSRTFSGGMNRRLNFAVALMHRPAFLMLDEPTVGVDPQSRAYLLDCIRTLREEGVSSIFASHYMEEVEALCDRIAIVDHGTVVADGTVKDLLSQLTIEIRMRIQCSAKTLSDLTVRLQTLPDVDDVTCLNSSGDDHHNILVRTSLRSDADADVAPLTSRLLDMIAVSGGRVLSVSTRESTLERLFLELTGRSLRD